MSIKNNTTSLQELLEKVNNLPNAGGSDPVLQDKTITPTISVQTVTADYGYDGLDTVTVNAMPTATQATPAITINASGLITATATQTAGYVAAGSKSATKQLAFQAAKTITPTTTSQTAVSSGYYTGGAVTVKGDSNLVAGNIKSGVSIFGVNGTYVGSGGGSGDTSVEDSLVTRTVSNYTNDRVTSVGSCAFYSYSNLTTVNFPSATFIGASAFYFCSKLTTASFPNATSIENYAFEYCSKLTTASFPNATSIGNYAFEYCSKLTTASFPNATSIGSYAFKYCYSLTTASFPKAITIGNDTFNYCSSLTTISFPVIRSIGNYAFEYCSKLTTASFPSATSIGNSAFRYCYSLTTASFPKATTIGGYAFYRCYNLKSLYLTGSSVCTLSNSNAFSSTPIGGYSTSAGTYGSIYVPASLLASYKAATNWTYFSSRFVGI